MNQVDERLQSASRDLMTAVDASPPLQFQRERRATRPLLRMAAAAVVVTALIAVPVLVLGGDNEPTDPDPVGATSSTSSPTVDPIDITSHWWLNLDGWHPVGAAEDVDAAGLTDSYVTYQHTAKSGTEAFASIQLQAIGFRGRGSLLASYESAGPTTVEELTVGRDATLLSFGDLAHAIYWLQGNQLEGVLFVEGLDRAAAIRMVESVEPLSREGWVELLAQHQDPTGNTGTTVAPDPNQLADGPTSDPPPPIRADEVDVLIEAGDFKLGVPRGASAPPQLVLLSPEVSAVALRPEGAGLAVGFAANETDEKLVVLGWAPAEAIEVRVTFADGTDYSIDQLVPHDGYSVFLGVLPAGWSHQFPTPDEPVFQAVAIGPSGEIVAEQLTP